MKILIIEDDKKIAGFIKKGLEEEHYIADVNPNGEQGAYQALVNTYDLLILDLMLPGMDGIEVSRFLRNKKNTTPILMLTARNQLEDKVNGLNAGADDYLTKPFEFEELLARVRALLRRQQKYKSENLVIADLELNPSRQKITRNGKNITLTSKEYALLEYLMRNQGRTVSKTQIMNHVWEVNYETFTNTVDVYIHHLRQKIDAPFKKKLIQTVRGTGYKMEEPDD